MHETKFGLFLPTDDVEAALAAAQRAEDEGFYSVSINDHYFSPLGTADTPQLECFTTLTAVAATTSRIRVTPSVAAISFRPPTLLAKIAATLDRLSRGRLTLGLGTGWHVDEYRSHGIPFPPIGERLEQLDETIRILRAMWSEDQPSFSGRHFTIDGAGSQPRPVQANGPPIMLGGSADGLLRVAAEHADIVNMIPPTANGKDFVNDPQATVRFGRERLVQRIATLRRMAEERGRDPEEIEVGGMLIVSLAQEREAPALAEVASFLGFSDVASASRCPVALLGTPDSVEEELRERIELGMSYFIAIPMNGESHELLAKEVMPRF